MFPFDLSRKKYLDAPSNFTDVISNIQWESEISDEEASLRILRQLYPFTKVLFDILLLLLSNVQSTAYISQNQLTS